MISWLAFHVWDSGIGTVVGLCRPMTTTSMMIKWPAQGGLVVQSDVGTSAVEGDNESRHPPGLRAKRGGEVSWSLRGRTCDGFTNLRIFPQVAPAHVS